MGSHWKMGAAEIHLRATGLFLLLCCIQEKKKTQMVVTDEAFQMTEERSQACLNRPGRVRQHLIWLREKAVCASQPS